MKSYQTLLGESIQNVRAKTGISQVELAKSTHISQSLVSKIETGALVPSVHFVRTLSKITKVPSHTFLDENPVAALDRFYRNTGSSKKSRK